MILPRQWTSVPFTLLFLVSTPSIVNSQHLGIDDLPDAEALECNGNLYLFQSQGSGVDTNFSQVNPDGTLSNWGNAADGLGGTVTQINAIGFNVEDGLIYGYAPDQTYGNHVFAVDANGNTYDLGDPTGINGTVFTGDMDGMGNLYLIRGGNLYRIDVDVFPLAAVQLTLDKTATGGMPNTSDFSIGPDNIIYGYDKNANQIWTIDLNQMPLATAYIASATSPPVGSPGTGQLGTVGGFYFDSFGNLYGYQNGTSNGNPPGIYFFNTTTGVTRLVTEGGNASRNDGASCAYSVGFQKTVSPSIARPGETVTYTFGISNLKVGGAAFTGISITDTLSTAHGGQFTGSVTLAGINHPAGDVTVSSTNGGTNNTIEIRDLTVPPGGITFIDVEVLIPDDAELCSVLENSASLNDELGQIPEGSSWPPGAIGPGPTQLAIVKPPEISKDVSIDSFETIDLPMTITYTFVINNSNPDILTDVDFTDSVPVGTIVNATLSDSLNGTVNAYGGTNSVAIVGANLPIGSTTVTIDVLITEANGPVGTHCNQAQIDDTVSSVFEVLSTDTADPAGSETRTCIEILGSLPVELASFDGLIQNNDHVLSWKTLSEKDVNGFEIQARFTENEIFSPAGFVQGVGDSDQSNSYSWTNIDVSSSMVYRLKITDIDGSYEYSPEVEIANPDQAFLSVSDAYPQPAFSNFNINYFSQENSQLDIDLFDLHGRVVKEAFRGQVSAKTRSKINVDVSDLSAGTYIYRLLGKSIESTGASAQHMGRIVVVR